MTTSADFMREAMVEAAAAAERGEVPVGAVAVLDGDIIARAGNRVEELHSALAHAEILAMRAATEVLADWRLDRVELYVTKEPCPMCAGAMVNSHLRKVFYGFSDANGGGCGSALDVTNFKTLLWHVEVESGLLGEECLAQFRAFFREVRARGSKSSRRETK